MTVVRVMFWCSLLLTDTLRTASPIPAERQVHIKVLETLAAPAAQPMHMPTDVAIDASGHVYIADGANDRIVRFTPDHHWDKAITQYGDQELNRPVGITIDRQDRLWITNTGLHQVLIVAPDGSLTQTVNLPAGPDRPSEPTDVAVSPDGQRAYIVDNDNHRLIIRENDSGTIQLMGQFGEAVGQFRWPFMICIDAENYVHVTEAIGARVQRLSPENRWSGQIGRWGVEMGQLYRPKGVAITPRGQVLVSDSTTKVVQVFSTLGAFQGVLCDESGKPFRFQHPMGMTFDRQGRLYVVELKADRVAVVELPPQWTTSAPSPTPEGR